MRILICVFAILVSGCASQEQLAEYEQNLPEDIHCPGHAEQSYNATIYSSGEPEKVGTTEVITRCHPVEVSTEFERENRGN